MFLQGCKVSVVDLSDPDKLQAETFRDLPANLALKIWLILKAEMLFQHNPKWICCISFS